MENASKALIIAGAVLLSVLIISLVVTVYGQISDWQQQVSDSEQVSSDSEYMLQIEQFNRTLYGSEILSLMNFVIDYNTRVAEDGESGYSNITLTVTITKEIEGQGEYSFFEPGDYDLVDIYDELYNDSTTKKGIAERLAEYEEPESDYNDKSVEYYWSKTYREIASEFGLTIPTDTAASDLEGALLAAADEAGPTTLRNIENLLEDIEDYDILNSIYTQFKEGKMFRPADEDGFVYNNYTGRVETIHFVEV